MPLQLLAVDNTDLLKLTAFYAKAPKKFARASGSMLNEFAFGTRNTAIETIRERMTVRNPRFIERQLRVDKASQRLPIQAQAALLGSVRAGRFSGWEEQQTGVRTARKRTINLLARMGTKKRQAAPRARLKPGKEFKSYKDFPGKGIEQKTITMLQQLDRQRWKQPFVIHEKRGMRPGLYRFKRRKPRLLQLFDPRRLQPKKIPWMTTARDRFFQRADIRALWARTIRVAMKR